ncbi:MULTISPECIES: hypothetical protein [unclassified Moorena]|nr:MULTISPECIES: hypothetical protein [unclassified Moorena]NEO05076.1 hypothetical protein [Moorena sp. SIO3I8]NEP21924.1 hypothetical protein [Moorena sp. SIO3I6]
MATLREQPSNLKPSNPQPYLQPSTNSAVFSVDYLQALNMQMEVYATP